MNIFIESYILQPSQGENGDHLFVYNNVSNEVSLYKKQFGSWNHLKTIKPQSVEQQPIDFSKIKTKVTSGDNVRITGLGTEESPYEISVKDSEKIKDFTYNESKGEITLFTTHNRLYKISLQHILLELNDLKKDYKELNEKIVSNTKSSSFNAKKIDEIANKNHKYYLSQTLVPLGIEVTNRGGGINGLSTGNYILIPHDSYLNEITWRYMASGSKQYSPANFFSPHEDLGGKKAIATLDIYSEHSLIGKGVIPKKAHRFETPPFLEEGSFVNFHMNIAEGKPHGLVVCLGLTSRSNKELIRI